VAERFFAWLKDRFRTLALWYEGGLKHLRRPGLPGLLPHRLEAFEMSSKEIVPRTSSNGSVSICALNAHWSFFKALDSLCEGRGNARHVP